MNRTDIVGRHYLTGNPVRLRPALQAHPLSPPGAGHAAERLPFEETNLTPTEHLWLAPALTDLQVNGFAGVDFQQDGVTAAALLHAAAALRHAGCSRWLLTLMTDAWPKITARLRHLSALRAQSVLLRHCIAGWHIEGPFLSAEPGYCGAHAAQHMCDPTADHIRELRAITESDPVLLTVAPERTGALDVIRLAVQLGIRVSLGHTNATPDTLRAAVAAGARGFTHFGNGCPVALDRHDNILWRAMELPGLTFGLIPDTFHVSPALFRLAHRVFDPASIYYVADAVAAAGAPPGRYTVGALTVEVGPDQIVRKPGSPQFAGSALRPVEGVFRAATMLGRPWQQVWDHFSVVPARFMGLPPSPDWCALHLDPASGALQQISWLENRGM
jgi:N-acetylglucosamine-6-phosphate deacetylase